MRIGLDARELVSHRYALENTVIMFWFHKRRETDRPSDRLSAFQEGLSFMELFIVNSTHFFKVNIESLCLH
jgi:hypothetical protein